MLVGNQSLPPREMTYDSPTFKKNWIYHNVYKNRSTKNIQSILISPNCHAIFTFIFYIDISHYTSLYATNAEKKWRNQCQKFRMLTAQGYYNNLSKGITNSRKLLCERGDTLSARCWPQKRKKEEKYWRLSCKLH